MMRSILDLGRGVSRHPWKTVQYSFTCFSVLFTVVTAVTHFLPTVRIEGLDWLIAAVIFSAGFGLRKVWKPSKIEICVANCNTMIEVVFGDLFQQDGIRTIAVTEFFESQLGKPVSDKSVHGQFLRKCFGGHPETFNALVERELKASESIVIDKSEGKNVAYEIGTTALVPVNQDRYLLFAFAKADPGTCKAHSDVTTMWVALSKLWERARDETGGYPINLPLVGSGLSGLGLPTRDLLNLIILSAITATKAKEITQIIRIILHRDRFDDLDLRDVEHHWTE